MRVSETAVRNIGWSVLFVDALVIGVLTTRFTPLFNQLLDDPELPIIDGVTIAQCFAFLTAIVVFGILAFVIFLLKQEEYGLTEKTDTYTPSKIMEYGTIALILIGEPFLSFAPFMEDLNLASSLGGISVPWYEIVRNVFFALVITVAHWYSASVTAAMFCLRTRDKEEADAAEALRDKTSDTTD